MFNHKEDLQITEVEPRPESTFSDSDKKKVVTAGHYPEVTEELSLTSADENQITN